MTIMEWIIRLSIFGVLAAAVIGTLQNIYLAIKGARKERHHAKS